jgi:hypothetical protein
MNSCKGFQTASKQLVDCFRAVFEKRVLIGFLLFLSLFLRKRAFFHGKSIKTCVFKQLGEGV